MSAVRGVLVGALSLIVLEVVVTRPDSFASLIAEIGGSPNGKPGLVGRALSADVALIPDHRTASKPSSSSGFTVGIPVAPGMSIPIHLG